MTNRERRRERAARILGEPSLNTAVGEEIRRLRRVDGVTLVQAVDLLGGHRGLADIGAISEREVGLREWTLDQVCAASVAYGSNPAKVVTAAWAAYKAACAAREDVEG